MGDEIYSLFTLSIILLLSSILVKGDEGNTRCSVVFSRSLSSQNTKKIKDSQQLDNQRNREISIDSTINLTHTASIKYKEEGNHPFLNRLLLDRLRTLEIVTKDVIGVPGFSVILSELKYRRLQNQVLQIVIEAGGEMQIQNFLREAKQKGIILQNDKHIPYNISAVLLDLGYEVHFDVGKTIRVIRKASYIEQPVLDEFGEKEPAKYFWRESELLNNIEVKEALKKDIANIEDLIKKVSEIANSNLYKDMKRKSEYDATFEEHMEVVLKIMVEARGEIPLAQFLEKAKQYGILRKGANSISPLKEVLHELGYDSYQDLGKHTYTIKRIGSYNSDEQYRNIVLQIINEAEGKDISLSQFLIKAKEKGILSNSAVSLGNRLTNILARLGYYSFRDIVSTTRTIKKVNKGNFEKRRTRIILQIIKENGDSISVSQFLVQAKKKGLFSKNKNQIPIEVKRKIRELGYDLYRDLGKRTYTIKRISEYDTASKEYEEKVLKIMVEARGEVPLAQFLEKAKQYGILQEEATRINLLLRKALHKFGYDSYQDLGEKTHTIKQIGSHNIEHIREQTFLQILKEAGGKISTSEFLTRAKERGVISNNATRIEKHNRKILSKMGYHTLREKNTYIIQEMVPVIKPAFKPEGNKDNYPILIDVPPVFSQTLLQ